MRTLLRLTCIRFFYHAWWYIMSFYYDNSVGTLTLHHRCWCLFTYYYATCFRMLCPAHQSDTIPVYLVSALLVNPQRTPGILDNPYQVVLNYIKSYRETNYFVYVCRDGTVYHLVFLWVCSEWKMMMTLSSRWHPMLPASWQSSSLLSLTIDALPLKRVMNFARLWKRYSFKGTINITHLLLVYYIITTSTQPLLLYDPLLFLLIYLNHIRLHKTLSYH